MKTVYSVADARENFAEILNTAALAGMPVTVEKYGRPWVRVSKVKAKDVSLVDKWAGIWKGKKWAEKVGKPSRHFRKRDYWS